MRLAVTDAGIYLTHRARVRDRARETAQEIIVIAGALDERGSWERSYEWRISTYGSDRIDRVDGGVRGTSDCHGRFTAEFTTLAEACETMWRFSKVQKDLMYAVGWTSWAGRKSLRPEDADPDERPDADGRADLAYLRRLGGSAKRREQTRVQCSRTNRASRQMAGRGWRRRRAARTRAPDGRAQNRDGESVPVVEFSVSNRSLLLTAESPTVERALEFVGIYTRLVRDFRLVLEWRWH